MLRRPWLCETLHGDGVRTSQGRREEISEREESRSFLPSGRLQSRRSLEWKSKRAQVFHGGRPKFSSTAAKRRSRLLSDIWNSVYAFGSIMNAHYCANFDLVLTAPRPRVRCLHRCIGDHLGRVPAEQYQAAETGVAALERRSPPRASKYRS